uniref:Si:ch211-210c8.6 n=2 Tax=Lepisosteus oculatus TaxID=7918 RepID=W5MBD3_LEPOC
VMGNAVVKTAAIDLAIQWSCWAVSAVFKSEKIYDLAGTGSFILLTHLSRRWGGHSYTRQTVHGWLVTAWGLRLGTFLFLRMMAAGQDRRFNNIRDRPGVFWFYWTMQGVWVFTTLLPTVILNTERRNPPLGFRDYLGWALWGVGFLMEAIADQQKWNFRRDPDNAGKFIRHGLWAYSRHPNYVGEIMQWAGLFISASSVMQGTQYLTVTSPLILWFLIRYLSGVPPLEEYALKKWGADPQYQKYVKDTPVFWPFWK